MNLEITNTSQHNVYIGAVEHVVLKLLPAHKALFRIVSVDSLWFNCDPDDVFIEALIDKRFFNTDCPENEK